VHYFLESQNSPVLSSKELNESEKKALSVADVGKEKSTPVSLQNDKFMSKYFGSNAPTIPIAKSFV
jgi:hypothetical protein